MTAAIALRPAAQSRTGARLIAIAKKARIRAARLARAERCRPADPKLETEDAA